MQLHQNQDRFEELNTIILLIGFEPAERARPWRQAIGVSFPFLLDLNRTIYQAYGLERSIYRAWHPRNLWFYFKRIARGGPLPKITADPNQMGGDVIIGSKGVVRFVHTGRDATDRPPVEVLLRTLISIHSPGDRE